MILRKLINRDWRTGEPVSVYDLADYKERWGYVYNMFHRQDMHAMLKESAIEEKGEGKPARLFVKHPVSCCNNHFDIYQSTIVLTSLSAKISTSKPVLSRSPTATKPNTI